MPDSKKPAKTVAAAPKATAAKVKTAVPKTTAAKADKITVSKVSAAGNGNTKLITDPKVKVLPEIVSKTPFKKRKITGILNNDDLLINTSSKYNKVAKGNLSAFYASRLQKIDAIVPALKDREKNKALNAPQMVNLVPKEFDPENFEYLIVVLSSAAGTLIPGLPVSLSKIGSGTIGDTGANLPYELLDTAVTDHNGVALFVVDRDKILQSTITDGEESVEYFPLKLHTASGLPDLNLPLIDQVLDIVAELDVFRTSVLRKNINITETLLNDFIGRIGEKFLFSLLPPLEEATQPLNRLFGSIGDNPFDKLPALFPPEVLKRLLKVSRNVFRDPILSRQADEGDFRFNRKPLIRRFQAAKNFKNTKNIFVQDPVRNFLFNVRQDWNFVGYTLGELTELESLDPGKIINGVVSEVESITENVQQVLNETLSRISDVTSSLSSTDTAIDLLLQADLKVKNRVSGGAIGGAMILPLPIPIALGGAAADVSHTLTSNSKVSSNLSTSIDINTSLQSVKQIVNNAIKRTLDARKLVQSTLNTATDAVSPLLSAAANLTRWALYENYVVNTIIEEVIEIRSVKIFDVETFRPRIPIADLLPGLDLSQDDLQQIINALGLPVRSFDNQFVQLDVFNEEEIVNYRRIFEPYLLDRSLGRHYGQLREIVNRQLAIENIGVRELEFTVFYESQLNASGSLILRVDPNDTEAESAQTSIRLQAGRSQVTGRIRFNQVVSTDDTGLIGDLVAALTLDNAPVLGVGALKVHRIGVKTTFDNNTTQLRYFDADLLSVDMTVLTNSGGTTDNETFILVAEFSISNPKSNPLYRHINDNAVYYLGLLIETAFHEPSLRADSQKIREFLQNLQTASSNQLDPESFWSLPLIRFEGDHILIYQEINLEDPILDIIKTNEKGSAMKMQLLSQGTYTEALQGVLSLPDALGKLHPSLLQELPAVTNILNGLGGGTPIDAGVLEDLLSGASGGNGNVTEILENLSPEQANVLSQLIAGALGRLGGN